MQRVDITDLDELVGALGRYRLEVDTSNLVRHLYSSDASLYRVRPAAVVLPRDGDDVEAVLDVCRNLGVPLTGRGAGTSIAGNAIGPGVVIDTSRYMNEIEEPDIDARTISVQPGAVQADVQRRVASHGLRFGPDPSTSNRCTIGGMIGNNACGSRALAYGRTSDNVVGAEIITGGGERLDTRTPANSQVMRRLEEISTKYGELIRQNFGTFSRQVSGYALENLVSRDGIDLTRLIAGSEGTLAMTTRATLRLVADPPVRVLVVLGYESMPAAADAVMAVLEHHPTACEGLDARIVDAVRLRHGASRVPPLPKGNGWLFVELPAETLPEGESLAARVVGAAGALDAMVVTNQSNAALLWRIREDGAGLSAISPAGKPAYAGWEDAAVPPDKLGPYLRDFDALMTAHGLTGMPYGHFGDGCVHVRLDFPLLDAGGPGAMRAFLEDAARLVVRYGGSLSGEHGDGRARSELLAAMYEPEVLELFGEIKRAFDPALVLNPGVLVDPDEVDANLRSSSQRPMRTGLALDLRHDAGDFSAAVHRCTGVGKCRADTTASHGVMCPSFLATKNEKDSTRGRARVLQEMLAKNPTHPDWRASEVHEALDLCLMCKGCARDCPTGVDMGSYKAEVLHQSYKGRIRPRSHYSLGRLPTWARLASKTPRLANLVLGLPLAGRFAKWTAGVDSRRSLPSFAGETFGDWFARHDSPDGKPVVLWVDTFTQYFSPEVGIAAVKVLESAGYSVTTPRSGLCCGLTWISTGQLDVAAAKISDSLDAIADALDEGIPVVGLEPSCLAVFRSDARELAPGARAEAASKGVFTLAELLHATPEWEPPSLGGVTVIAQPHCHQSSVMGWDADATLLSTAGATVDRVGGCCGLAGNFGVERGHYETSVAIAEHDLLPAVREHAGATVLADGFSCRTQVADLEGRNSMHLAQLLARHLK